MNIISIEEEGSERVNGLDQLQTKEMLELGLRTEQSRENGKTPEAGSSGERHTCMVGGDCKIGATSAV